MEMEEEIHCLKDRGKVNADTVWQWRIFHAKKYSTHPDPFFYSNKIGLNFNVASSSHPKLNSPFVPNGVILEVCEFARTINKSRMHFIPNILENNFDLGFENDQQRMDFTAQIQHKLEDLIRNPLKDKNEVFALFDTWKTECSNNGLNKATRTHKPQSFFMEIENISELEQLLKCSSEKETEEISASHTDGGDQKDNTDCSGGEMKEVVSEDIPLLLFTSCENIGLKLGTGTKQSLDPGLLTERVMLELLDFARVLTASFTSIVVSVLEHNFELDLKSQERRNEVWLLISQMLKRGKQIASSNTNFIPEFENEPFFFERNPLKRAYVPALSTVETLLSEETKRQKLDFSASQEKMPPSVTKCIMRKDQGQLDENVNGKSLSHINELCSSTEEEDEHCHMCPEDETLQNIPNKSDMNHEEMEAETNMWKFRSNYVKKILLALNNKLCLDRRGGTLEFDIGCRPPRNASPKQLTSSVLYKVVHFALAMSSSQQNVLVDILEYNFNLGLQREYQKITFTCEVMKRVQELLARDDRDNILKEVFVLPGSLSLSNVKCESDDSVDSEPETSQTASDLYPFCKKIGLKLNVSFCHPDKKLELHKLTNGAMIEVVNFAEKLCGSYEQICVDVLRHNFDLDSQISDSDLAQNILSQVPFAIEETNLRCFFKKTQLATRIDLNVMDSQRNTSSQTCTVSSVKAEMNQSASQPGDVEAQNDPELVLWKLRANQVQQILSVPHGDQCPLYSYSRCKTLGIDFDVGSGLKRRLDPKLLTNGIMCEIVSLATKLGSSTMDFMTEIMKYNFNLHFNNVLHRKAFANALHQRMIEMNFRKPTIMLLKSLFELPDEKFIHEVEPFVFKGQQNGYLCPANCSHTVTNVASAVANNEEKKSAVAPMSTFPATEVITKQYRRSKKAGLSLCVDNAHPKVKLDKYALTCGVVQDVYSFSKKLCGTKLRIVNDILQHNFDLDHQSHVENIAFHFISRLRLYSGEPHWFNEVFDMKPNPREFKLKEPPPVLSSERRESSQRRKQVMQKAKELIAQRQQAKQMEENISSHRSDLSTSQSGKDYMCPVEEERDSENDVDAHQCVSQARWDFSSGAQMNDVGKHHLTTSNAASTLNGNTSMRPQSQPDESHLAGDDEEEHVPRNLPNGCIIDQEMDPELKMWKLRANRVRQILPFVKRMSVQIFSCKRVTVEFDVGFQPKRNLSPDHLTNFALFCIALFALEMNASQEEFMMEILKNNFDLHLNNDSEKSFASEVIKQVRELVNCGEAAKDLKEVFRLPGFVSFSDLNHQTSSSIESEPHPTSEECDVSPMAAPSLSAENELSTATETSQNNVDLYPFCNDIGLKLTVCGCQPNQKLDVNKLTKGAMIEVLTFAEKLCGSYEQICVDVLRHNFDLDLQDADSDLARKVLEQVPLVIAQINVENNFKKFTSRGKFNPIDINCRNSPSSESCNTGSIKANIDHSMIIHSDIKVQNDPDLLLWRLRANRIQEILSVPHGEQCPFYPYKRCVKSGIDFNVGSGLKRNLDPKLLTNGIMCELYTFATELESSMKHFMTEILEYNFNLHFNSCGGTALLLL
ncbi:uncharacterized protein LOC115402290 [Salarias fasciatus]|uniref:uncharacterized protein LOC115402290 n=1 Tax=Salarias fasciatus TaxID=181472 RepID=UPI001176F5DD|nr:uncharacterized protein LOC115402290 [Salarias fasciatus]